MTSLSRRVESLLDAVDIDAGTAVRWFGRPLSDVRLDAPSAARESLMRFLYTHFYCPGAAEPINRSVPLAAVVDHALIGRCDTAFGGIRLRTSPVSSGQIRWRNVVWRDTDRGNGMFTHPYGLGLSPGFRLYTITDTATTPDAFRVYVNCWPGGFPLLLSTVREMWNFLGMAAVKVATPPIRTMRTDSCVLYLTVPPNLRPDGALWNLITTMTPWLRGSVPAFTLRVAPGVAVAQSPPSTQDSFGTSRCRLVADAIVDCWETDRSMRPFPEVMARRFHKAGVDPARPFQNLNAEVGLRLHERPPRLRPRKPTASLRDAGVALLQAVRDERIETRSGGFWLAADASAAQAADASVYNGHAGLALTFARAFALGIDEMGQAASQAAERALASLDRLSPHGHHLGRPGALAALHLTGSWLQDATLTSRVHTEVNRFIHEALQQPREGVWFDLLHGRAGTIVALAAMVSAYPQVQRLLETELTVLREHLLRLKESSDRADLPPGLAHGATGVVAALAAAAQQADGPIADDTLVRALIDSEDEYFVTATGNWRRYQEGSPAHRWPADRYFWCHGAPGIVLARRSLADAASTHDPLRYISHSSDVMKSLMRFPDTGHDWSLCHGAAGLAACARFALAGLGAAESFERRQWQLLHVALTQGRTDRGWHPPIGLMNGRAGIALAALEMTASGSGMPALRLALGIPSMGP